VQQPTILQERERAATSSSRCRVPRYKIRKSSPVAHGRDQELPDLSFGQLQSEVPEALTCSQVSALNDAKQDSGYLGTACCRNDLGIHESQWNIGYKFADERLDGAAPAEETDKAGSEKA
jgi:hypothetical protein